MKSFSLILLSSIICSLALGAAVKPKFVQFDVESKKIEPGLLKRSQEFGIEDQWSYYMAKLKVGSNEQEMDLLVDTGSNALWVVNSDACDSCSHGTFNSGDSSSFEKLNDDFTITYGSGRASGEWAKDTITVGDSKLSAQQIGVASEIPAQYGILGLTYSPDDTGMSPSYENFPKRLKSEGVIDRQAFSFYAGPHGKNDGALLFGAIDHSKYTGSLLSVAMGDTDTTVAVNGVNIDSSYSGVEPKILYSAPKTALVDIGTSITTLPTDAFNSLIDSLNAENRNGQYFVDCGLMNEDVKLNYDFSGVRIKVSIKDLIYQESNTACMLGVAGSDGRLVFGANALRSVYTVFDLEGKRLGLAQANTNPGSENIQTITGSI